MSKLVVGSAIALMIAWAAGSGCDSGAARKHLGTQHPKIDAAIVLIGSVPTYAVQASKLQRLLDDGQIWVVSIPGQRVAACQRPLIPLIQLDRHFVQGGTDPLDLAPILIHELYHWNHPWKRNEDEAAAAGKAWRVAFDAGMTEVEREGKD